MSIKVTVPNNSSDSLIFGSANTTNASQVTGIDSGSSNGQLAFYTTASGVSTERMRIDSSGNVGVGTSSPSTLLHLYRNSAAVATTLTLQNAATAAGSYATVQFDAGTVTSQLFSDAGGGVYSQGAVLRTTSSHPLMFGTNSSERMRIDSSGNVGVGTTTPGSLAKFAVVAAAQPMYLLRTDSGTLGLLTFATASTYRGEVYYDSGTGQLRFTGNAAGTYSDSRLKNVTGDCQYGLAAIQQLSAKKFTWLRNEQEDFGFVAQELYQVIPEAVEVGKDVEIDPKGEFDPRDIWKVDYPKLVPVLVKAIQELKAELDTVKTELATLKGQA